VGLRKIGLELQRFPIGGERFVELAFVEKGEAKITLGDRLIRLKNKGLVEISDGFVDFPLGVESETEIAIGLREVWIDGERLAELLDGFVDFARFVEFEAAIIEFDRLIVGGDLRLRLKRIG